MRKHWISTLCLSWLLAFALGSGVLAQTDSDGDLNADTTDPFPSDPSQGGVYAGGTITYNVLMTGDLDATSITGTVLTIAADGVTFDGNGHKIIASNAETVISLTGRSGVTVKNVNVAGDPATRTGRGFFLNASSNNTVTNCDASDRGIGILVVGVSNSNVMSNNRIRNTSDVQQFAGYYGAIVVAIAGAGGNKLLDNDVQGSYTGMAIVGDSQLRSPETFLATTLLELTFGTFPIELFPAWCSQPPSGIPFI